MAGQRPVEDIRASTPVFDGLLREHPYVPAISLVGALCPPDRDRRDKPGDDEPARHEFCPCYETYKKNIEG